MRARECVYLTGGMYSAEYVFTGVVDTVVSVFQPESEVFSVDVCVCVVRRVERCSIRYV